MKHTPGPWRINEGLGCQYGHFGCTSGYWRIENSSGCGIAYVAHQIKRQDANARLIAAAPIGLELADAVIRWWKEHQYDTEGAYGEYNTYDETPDFVKLAEAFATEATGEK